MGARHLQGAVHDGSPGPPCSSRATPKVAFEVTNPVVPCCGLAPPAAASTGPIADSGTIGNSGDDELATSAGLSPPVAARTPLFRYPDMPFDDLPRPGT